MTRRLFGPDPLKVRALGLAVEVAVSLWMVAGIAVAGRILDRR